MQETKEKSKIIHHFEWGAGNWKVEVHLPKKIKQISSIEQAVTQGYIPYQTRVYIIGFSKCKRLGVNEEKNTYTGLSMVLELDELDVPVPPAQAYVPSGLDYQDERVNIPKQMIIDFLYFTKPQ